jgi:hypothetical protein
MKYGMRMVMAGLLLAACGGGDDDDDMTADRMIIVVPDAGDGPDGGGGGPDGGGGSADAGPHVCLTEQNFGAATLGDQQAQSGGGASASDPDGLQFAATLNADPMPDLLYLELYKGYGVFSTMIMTGTFNITGMELNYATCGVCPRIFTDYDTGTGMSADQQYFATGGSVTINTLTPNFTGSVNNLEFEEVTVNPTTFESTPVPGGCTTAVMSGAFDIANMYTP